MEHIEKRELTEQERKAFIEYLVKNADWKRLKERRVFKDKVWVITSALERGEINADELIEKYGLAERLSY